MPVAWAVGYDVLVFQPRLPDIENILSNADPEDKNPPLKIQELIEVLHEGSSSSQFATRNLLFRLHLNQHSGLGWAGRFLMWSLLVDMHLPRAKIIALYATLAYNGENSGLNNLSKRLYAKPLSALSLTEAATVIAVLKSPSLYLQDNEKLVKYRNVLLARLGRF